MKLQRLKELLGIPEEDDSQDTALLFIMENTEDIMLNYCNLEELPEKLVTTAYRMAIDLYRYERPGEGEGQVMVSSVTEGDTATSFQGMDEVLKESVLKAYRTQLNRFRKLRR